jgi:imidazoleglycerol-phosphate dehydratase
MGKRKTKFTRATKETDIAVTLALDGEGSYCIDTGIDFLDHMLELFTKHGLFDMTVKARSVKDADGHHTNEDVGISLGKAFAKALDKKTGINRFGFFMVPMDEATASCVLDISGRPYLEFCRGDDKRKILRV